MVYHPAAYHCLDVAASAHALLSANALLRSRLAEALGIPESDTLSLVTAWAALHDVGKFSAPFQAQVPRLWLHEMGGVASIPTGAGHGTAGLVLWTAYLHEDLSELMPQGRRLMPLARSVFGHHGRPVPDREPIDVETLYREQLLRDPHPPLLVWLLCTVQYYAETRGA